MAKLAPKKMSASIAAPLPNIAQNVGPAPMLPAGGPKGGRGGVKMPKLKLATKIRLPKPGKAY